MGSTIRRRGKIPKDRIRRIQHRSQMLKQIFPFLPIIDPRNGPGKMENDPNRWGGRIRLLRAQREKSVVLKKPHAAQMKTHHAFQHKVEEKTRNAKFTIKEVRKMIDWYHESFGREMKEKKYRLVKPRAYAIGTRLILMPRHYIPTTSDYSHNQKIMKIVSLLRENVLRGRGYFLGEDDFYFLGFDKHKNMVFMPTVDL